MNNSISRETTETFTRNLIKLMHIRRAIRKDWDDLSEPQQEDIRKCVREAFGTIHIGTRRRGND